jgi:RNA polymerase sigma-70 factor (ECF subfamily)
VDLPGRPRHGTSAVGEPAEDETAPWAALGRRIARGDAAAEAELAECFHARVRVLATARLDGSDTAQDIAQETIVAVLKALRAGQVRELEKLPAFVLGTATNLINNHRRQRARSREAADAPPDPPGPGNPSLTILAAERDALVRKSIGRLSAVDQRILLLTLVDGLTPREIAPLVGLTPKTVRNRKSRAVDAVAADIQAHGRIRRESHIQESD